MHSKYKWINAPTAVLARKSLLGPSKNRWMADSQGWVRSLLTRARCDGKASQRWPNRKLLPPMAQEEVPSRRQKQKGKSCVRSHYVRMMVAARETAPAHASAMTDTCQRFPLLSMISEQKPKDEGVHPNSILEKQGLRPQLQPTRLMSWRDKQLCVCARRERVKTKFTLTSSKNICICQQDGLGRSIQNFFVVKGNWIFANYQQLSSVRCTISFTTPWCLQMEEEGKCINTHVKEHSGS